VDAAVVPADADVHPAKADVDAAAMAAAVAVARFGLGQLPRLRRLRALPRRLW